MPSSNNANAGMGNSSTKSNNAQAAPTIISGGGPTPPPSTGALAIFDFSTMSNQDLKVNGSYTIPVSGGSTTATTAQIQVFKGNTGIGVNGIQRINNGFLEFNPDIVTSELGLEYWSNVSCPFLGIDIRTLSTKLNTVDTKFQELQYEIVAEIVPEWVNGTRVVQVPIYVYMYVGFLNNLDLWASNNTPRPTGNFVGFRETTNIPGTRAAEFGGICFADSSLVRGSFSHIHFQTATAPFNSWYNSTTTIMKATWDGVTGSQIQSNGTIGLKRNCGVLFSNTYNPPTTFNTQRGTNNLWAVVYASRSTSSIQSGDVPYRIKKLSIFERTLL